MAETTTAPTPTTPPTSSNGSTGTAPTNQGPGTGAALETALTNYLAGQLAAAGQNGSFSPLPMPQAQQAPIVQVIETPAKSNSLPLIVAGIATVIGVASGAAYLIDRRKHA